jgi:hypothetical protein
LGDISNANRKIVKDNKFYIRYGDDELVLREYRSKEWKWCVEALGFESTGEPYKIFKFDFADKPCSRFVPETDSLLVLGTEAEHLKILEFAEDLKIIEK